ncbi:uncharacterized protein LOC134257360 [Saccostrea cucullata]|uniref:uncharacterized protein LOC134257360 n=1 Tax=Saccostrea cuccullata TaxID=36930 RepID=UPI002ED10A7E
MEDDIPLFLLGGNHLVSACKKLLLEEPNNDLFDSYRFFQVEVFIELTPEEAKLVGNIHSAKNRIKELTFQDQVFQAGGIFLRDSIGDEWKETTTVVLSHLQQKVCKKDSLNVVFSVASYDDSCFAEVERMFALWGKTEFPPKLFKALLGLTSDVVLQHLMRIQTQKDVHLRTTTIKLEKKREMLRKIFMDRTGCATWEEAEDNFEPYTHEVDKFLGN